MSRESLHTDREPLVLVPLRRRHCRRDRWRLETLGGEGGERKVTNDTTLRGGVVNHMILTWVGSVVQQQHPDSFQAEVPEFLVVGQRYTPTESPRGGHHT